MREILFRGMTVNGKFVEGNLSILKNDLHYSAKIDKGCYISNSCGAPFAYQVRPDTVGQFTGLTDKNGKKIFEGDILQWVDEDNTCEGTKLIFIVKFDGEYEGFFGEGEFDNIEPWQFRDHEIIGNIHDQKEDV